MNKVILIGRLTADPEVSYTTGTNAFARARFRVAVNRPYKNAEGKSDADFISCVAWRNNAEFVNKYFHKGDPIALEGSIRVDNYTNKDGVKVYTTDVMVDHVEFPGNKSQNSGLNGDHAAVNTNDFMNIPDTSNGEDSLPFE